MRCYAHRRMGHGEYSIAVVPGYRSCLGLYHPSHRVQSLLTMWDPRYQFYIKTNFCELGIGFIGMQPARDSISMAATCNKMKAGPCEFLKDSTASNPSQVMPS